MFGWFRSKNKEKIKETIKTDVKYYDSYVDVALYWEDVLEVLTLADIGNEESIRTLQQKYKLENKYGKELYVTLSTMQPEGVYGHKVYPGNTWDFNLTEVQRIYEKELEHRETLKEWEIKRKKEEDLHKQRNSIESLQNNIKEFSLKKKN